MVEMAEVDQITDGGRERGEVGWRETQTGGGTESLKLCRYK